MKENSSISWVGFSILLIILHLYFGWGVANAASIRALNLLKMFPIFLALAIVNYITAIYYIHKQRPPWKVFFIPLLVAHLMAAPLTLGLFVYLGPIGFIYWGVWPLIFNLAIIDCIAVFFYKKKQFTPMPDSILDSILIIVAIILSGIFTYIISNYI
jgi:hypothetical protein